LDYLSRAGLEELFGAGNLTLGVHIGYAPLDTGDADFNNTLRTLVVLTSNASDAIADEEVKEFMHSLQDTRDDELLFAGPFLDRIKGFMNQLNTSQSEFTAVPLRSADLGILSRLQKITANDFPVKVKSRKTEVGQDDNSQDGADEGASDNEEFDRLLLPLKSKSKKGLTSKCV
jgi:hypothetical protein